MKNLLITSSWIVLSFLFHNHAVAGERDTRTLEPSPTTERQALAAPQRESEKKTDVEPSRQLHNADTTLFSRGDANSDGEFNMSDILTTVGWLFLGQRDPACMAAADMDDSGDVALADAVRASSHLFLGAKPLPAPFPGCGRAQTSGRLSCDFSPCQTTRNRETEEKVIDLLMLALDSDRNLAKRIAGAVADDELEQFAVVLQKEELDLVAPEGFQEAICVFGICVCSGDADCDILISSNTCVEGTEVCYDVDGGTVCTCQDAS